MEAEHDEDALADLPATISHQVDGSDYGSVSAASLRVTIVEDDFPTLSIESPEPMPESGGTLRFRATLSTASSKEVTVDYATSDGSGVAGARAGSDYAASTGALTFAAGSTTPQFILVDVMNDEVDEEEAETLELTLRNARNASLAGGGATLQTTATIRDDDDPEVEISFGSPRYEAVEGATVPVAVYLNRDPERSLVIDLIRTHRGGGNGRRLLGRAPERHVPQRSDEAGVPLLGDGRHLGRRRRSGGVDLRAPAVAGQRQRRDDPCDPGQRRRPATAATTATAATAATAATTATAAAATAATAATTATAATAATAAGRGSGGGGFVRFVRLRGAGGRDG